MITNLERHITYICPLCGMVTTRLFSPFAFSGRRQLDIVCPNPMCGTHCVTVYDKKTRYSFSADCPICGNIHEREFRRSDMWKEPLISVSCNETDVGICFIGDKNELRRAVKKSQEDYAALNAEAEDFYKDYVPENGDKRLGATISCISEVLHGMETEGLLSCRCGSRSISITLIDGALRLRCRRCGSMSTIEPSNEFLRSLASMDSYIFNK